MPFNQELQEDLINSSILRSAFFNYFYRVFNNTADESFIGVSEKYLTYFNNLKDYVVNIIMPAKFLKNILMMKKVQLLFMIFSKGLMLNLHHYF